MDKVVLSASIGWSAENSATRNIGWQDLIQHGWEGWIEKWIKPAIQLGFARFEIHNPFGTLAGEDMQADQAISARESGLVWDYQDFVEAWRPITEKYEVIAYLGTPILDNNFTILKNSKYGASEYIQRLWDSYRLPLDAGMSIGFDAAAVISSVNDPSYAFIELVRNLGRKVYIEAWPPKVSPHLFKYSTVFSQSVWENMQVSDWDADPSLIQGEKLRGLWSIPTGPLYEHATWQNFNNWGPIWVKDCWKNGHTAMFGYWDQITANIPLSKWLGLSTSIPPISTAPKQIETIKPL